MIILLSTVLCMAVIACKNTGRQTVSTVAQLPEVTTGKIQISGAFALYPLVKIWIDEFQKEYPDIEFEIMETGTGQGLLDIFSGKAELAMVSREINLDEAAGSLWLAPVARGAVVAVFNSNHPNFEEIMRGGLSNAEILEIFTSNVPLKWNSYFKNATSQEIKVYSRADDSGAADVFASFLNCYQTDFKGTKVVGDENMILSIQKEKYSLGFCNLNFVFNLETGKPIEDIQILPIDLNFNGKIDINEIMADSLYIFQRKMWTHRFPRNLCRTLYMASTKLPENETRLFMQWVLKEGQDYIVKTGYSELNSSEIACKLKSLE